MSPIRNAHEVAGVRYGNEEKMVVAVALTSSNELFGRRNLPGEREPLFRFDRKSNMWVPVNSSVVASPEAPFSLLVGSDAEALVYLTAATNGSRELTWFKPTTE
jgi:hypothetical protein